MTSGGRKAPLTPTRIEQARTPGTVIVTTPGLDAVPRNVTRPAEFVSPAAERPAPRARTRTPTAGLPAIRRRTVSTARPPTVALLGVTERPAQLCDITAATDATALQPAPRIVIRPACFGSAVKRAIPCAFVVAVRALPAPRIVRTTSGRAEPSSYRARTVDPSAHRRRRSASPWSAHTRSQRAPPVSPAA